MKKLALLLAFQAFGGCTQDFIAGGITAMTIHQQAKAPLEGKDAQAMQATLVVIMLASSALYFFNVVSRSFSLNYDFSSDLFTLLSPLSEVLEQETQEIICKILQYMGGGMTFLSALHFFSPDYMLDKGKLSRPIQAMRTVAMWAPALGRDLKVEVCSYLAYGVTRLICNNNFKS